MKNNTNQNDLSDLRHSCAHLLAAAVMELYPKAKRTIGPSIEHGFYFDFDFGDMKISEVDLPKIETKMQEILPSWKSFDRHELTADEAKKEYLDNPYKHELIDEFSGQGETLSFYKSGDYWDLCRGGHVEHPDKELQYFKILSIAGAYWRGSEKNKMLTRIYGTVFPTQQALDDYIAQQELAKGRDHKKLARELKLIVFSDLVGAGLPLYTPKGAILRNAVYDYSRYLNNKIGYKETALPNMNRGELFKVSGHYEKYKDDMFTVHSHYSKEEFFLKPMNCPQHCVLFESEGRSYKDLPVRFSDFSVLYRDERPGEINGLLRSRAFTQDDGHCFCREDQIKDEFQRVLGVVDEALKTYGFAYWIRLSLRDPSHPEKYLGNNEIWNKAEAILRDLVKESNITYKDAPGEAAIYGPKLDFMAVDSLGREWQISTIQLDMNMPGRFGLTYTDSDGSKKTPVMIHRAIIGSERFIAVLIEHYGGSFPTWLNPVQVKVLPVSDKHTSYGQQVADQLKEAGVRAELDNRNERLQAKIRDAQNEKVSYMLIVGDKEVEACTVSERGRSGKNYGQHALSAFITNIRKEIDERMNI